MLLDPKRDITLRGAPQARRWAQSTPESVRISAMRFASVVGMHFLVPDPTDRTYPLCPLTV